MKREWAEFAESSKRNGFSGLLLMSKDDPVKQALSAAKEKGVNIEAAIKLHSDMIAAILINTLKAKKALRLANELLDSKVVLRE